MFDDIITRRPVNQTAATVTGQKGCSESMTLEDRKDTLLRALKFSQRELAGLPDNHRYRKELGVKILELQDEMSRINAQVKVKNVQDQDLTEYIVSECRKGFTRSRWSEILHAARAAKKRDITAAIDRGC